MKGQTVIMQFVLSFLFGLFLFLSIGNVYKIQFDIFSSTVSQKTRDLLSSFATANFIELNSCTTCDIANSTIHVQTPPSVFLWVVLNPDSLNVTSLNGQSNATSKIHNLLSSFVSVTGKALVTKPIILSLMKAQNTLSVTQ